MHGGVLIGQFEFAVVVDDLGSVFAFWVGGVGVKQVGGGGGPTVARRQVCAMSAVSRLRAAWTRPGASNQTK
jgi:hypothetical protein